MHIFTLKVLIYLSFHFLGMFLGMMSMIGTPGQLNTDFKINSFILNLLSIGAVITLKAIPILLFVSFLCFFLQYDILAKVVSYFSLGTGLIMLLSIIWLYISQSKS